MLVTATAQNATHVGGAVNNAVFQVRGVSKSYRLGDVEVHALKSVDLELYRGEFVVILGPSGDRSSHRSVGNTGRVESPSERALSSRR